jgi:mannose-1-phosphate guanylyltransferase
MDTDAATLLPAADLPLLGANPAAETAAILPVVLCGGAGTRLWPLSREARPKQFLKLLSERTMLQETLLRATGTLPDGTGFAAPMIICNQEHRFEAAGQALAAGFADAEIVLEPEGSNSAPSVAVSAFPNSVRGS